METGSRTNKFRMVLEPIAAFTLHSHELVKALEMMIDEGLIGQGPQTFSRLKFRGIGWQKPQA